MTTATEKQKVRKTYVQSMVTLGMIRQYCPCPEGWERLLQGLQQKRGYEHLPHDKPFPMSWVRSFNGNCDFRWLVLRMCDHARGYLRTLPRMDDEQKRRSEAMILALYPEEADNYDLYSSEWDSLYLRRDRAGKWGDYAEMTACLAICDGKVAA